MTRAIHNRQTLTRMAACNALGLHYWAGHPQPGCVWAVDDFQQAHVVRIYARDNIARKVERFSQGYRWSTTTGPAVPFAVSNDTQYLFSVPTNQPEGISA